MSVVSKQIAKSNEQPKNTPSIYSETQSITKEIVSLHKEIKDYFVKVTLKKAMRIGELLMRQKELLGHGNYTKWIVEKLPFCLRTAQRYAKIYNNKDKLKNDSVSFISEAHKILTAPNMTLEEEQESADEQRRRLYTSQNREQIKKEMEDRRLSDERKREIENLATYYTKGFPGTGIRLDSHSLDFCILKWDVEHPRCQYISRGAVFREIDEIMPDIFADEMRDDESTNFVHTQIPVMVEDVNNEQS